MALTIKAPSNAVFKGVHLSSHRYIVMKGSAGSGKSVDTAQQYIIRLMSQKGRNLVCVRKSDVTNRDSTFAELRKAINTLGVADFWESRLVPLSLTCYNGNQIIFRGVNDDTQREKLKSITFANGDMTDVWIEEATELTQSDFEVIDDRLRGDLPKGLFYQIKLTFNPVSALHWIKAAFFDLKDSDVLTHHSTYLDNRFIDEAYHRRMERKRILDPQGYEVYGLGNWGETSGLILSNWVVEDIKYKPEDFDSLVNAQDFGFNHANAILAVGFKDGDIYICGELYEYEKDTAELIKLAEGRFEKRAIMYCDSAEPDRIKMWQKAGYMAQAVKKDKGSVGAQIDYLKQCRIHVSPVCINAIKELQQWKWQKDRKTDKYLDKPVEFFDDAMAALRYSIEGMRRQTRLKSMSKKDLGL